MSSFVVFMLSSAFIILMNSMPGTPGMQVSAAAKIQKNENECLKYSTPIEKRLALKQDLNPFILASSLPADGYFNPIQLQRNNNGTAKYKLTLDEDSKFRVNIQLYEGPMQGTLKGGELDGFYVLWRSVLAIGNDDDETGLHIWNIYVRKHESPKSDSAHNVMALKVTLQENEKMNPNLIPILDAMEKLSQNLTSVFLPINYDIYAILPTETAFAIYESNIFPFPYPSNLTLTNDINITFKSDSQCGPILKVYAFTHTVPISKKQLEHFYNIGKKLGKVIPSKLNSNSTSDSERNDLDNKLYDLGKVSYTPLAKHLLFRRMVAEAQSHEGMELSEDDEDYDDDDDEESDEPEEEEFIDEDDPAELAIHEQPIIPQDEELFPPDCAILYKITADFEGQNVGRLGNNLSGRSNRRHVLSFLVIMVETFLGVLFQVFIT